MGGAAGSGMLWVTADLRPAAGAACSSQAAAAAEAGAGGEADSWQWREAADEAAAPAAVDEAGGFWEPQAAGAVCASRAAGAGAGALCSSTAAGAGAGAAF